MLSSVINFVELGPNIDFFSLEELKGALEKFKENEQNITTEEMKEQMDRDFVQRVCS